MMLRAGGLALVLSVAGSVGCSSDIEIGENLRRSNLPAQGGSGAVGGSGGVSGTGGASCVAAYCQGKIFECGNCIDDDLDGAIDSDDIYCTGPCDDNEGSFAIDIRDGNAPPCKQDCFFDSDVGSGNDGCNWSHRCDPWSAPPNYPPSGDAMCSYDEDASIPGMSASCLDLRTAQDPMCASSCGPLVPNGCDCFGCCELPAGSNRFVWLGSESATGCTQETIDDPTVCRPCTQVEPCVNDCDPCEVCVGRTAPDPSCSNGGTPTCPTGMAACGVEGAPRCGEHEYCITGCCVEEPR